MAFVEKETKQCIDEEDNSYEPIQPNKLETGACPKHFDETFNILPTYQSQKYDAEAVFEGEQDKRYPYDNNKIDFYSRVGQLRMTFDKLKKSNGKYKSFVGTATVFYIDDNNKRAYAITAGHNLIHFHRLKKTIHTLKHMWFDRRITSSWKVYTSSKSIKKYKVDQYWIHPNYDLKEVINPYDLGVISFIDTDAFFRGSNQQKSSLNIPIQHSFATECKNASTILKNESSVFGTLLQPVVPMMALLYTAVSDASFWGISIVGYPGEKQGQLWGEIILQEYGEYYNSYEKYCKQEFDGKMISYGIHTSGGQSGSSIVTGRGSRRCNKILAIHTSTNNVDSNYGVVLNEENINWILKCVLSQGKSQDVKQILNLFT